MATEIERKFLLTSPLPMELLEMTRKAIIKQAYLSLDKKKTIRVRTSNSVLGPQAFITVKGEANESGMSRVEVEANLAVEQALELMHFKEGSIIEKTRYTFPVLGTASGLKWEVDQFHGENAGLWLVEVELKYEAQEILIPHWVGEEVTHDFRYTNAYLAQNPYSTWSK